MVPAPKTGAEQCRSPSTPPRPTLGHLATTLMVCTTLFKAGNGFFSVWPSSEFDGDPDMIVAEDDPFAA